MKQKRLEPTETAEVNGVDFPAFRIERAKEAVDLSPNTIRAYIRDGLPAYKKGRATFVFKNDLVNFIKAA